MPHTSPAPTCQLTLTRAVASRRQTSGSRRRSVGPLVDRRALERRAFGERGGAAGAALVRGRRGGGVGGGCVVDDDAGGGRRGVGGILHGQDLGLRVFDERVEPGPNRLG